jgi:hypothetical protein
MLELHKKKNSIPPSAEREKVEREIAVADERIDEIVYGIDWLADNADKVIHHPLKSMPDDTPIQNKILMGIRLK